MTDLFLIAHKVRGEPAFDVAERMICPECNGHGDLNIADATFIDCVECECLGYWWIIPTSGHRAYPYWARPLSEAKFDLDVTELSYNDFHYHDISDIGEMPSGLPDHYPTRHSSSPSLDISTLLAPAVKVKIERRF